MNNSNNKEDYVKNYSLNNSSDYINRLNTQQKHAVTCIDDNPLLILAGSGTGKTTVLIARMLYLIDQKKISSSKILAITFTNQAAQNIKDRFISLGYNIPKIKTFHSFCSDLLRKKADLINMQPNFTIINGNMSQKIIKEIMKDQGIEPKEHLKYSTERITYWQNNGLSPKEIDRYYKSKNDEIAIDIYHRYTENLQKHNSIDFGGLIIKSIEVLRNPHILKEYHQYISHVMVDEYQDVNPSQYMLLRLLYQKEDEKQRIKLCCVGDEDQCIYEWRGSRVDHITHFEKDFKGANIIKLEQNYRSNYHILNTANKLISHNKNRIGKTLFTERNFPSDQKVKIHVFQESISETSTITKEIQEFMETGIPLNEIAILVRTSLQIKSFEDEFITQKIPYEVIKGRGFYDLREIRNAISYLRLTFNKNNYHDFMEIINTPKRGIGKESLKKIKEYADQHEISMFKATEAIIKTDKLQNKQIKTLINFINDIYRWEKGLKKHSKYNNIAEIILEESGYIEMHRNDVSSIGSEERINNLYELISTVGEYKLIDQFIEDVSLRENNNRLYQSLDCVKIMTLHAAKGLEFDTVFISGWEQGLFPHQNSIDSEDYEKELEEERRLAYVGITRAKNNCHLCYVINPRNHFYNNNFGHKNEPSQFLLEMYNPDHVQDIMYDDIFCSFNEYWENSFLESNILYKYYSKFNPGDLVRHEKFGTGKIIHVLDNKSDIEFDNNHRKLIYNNFIKKL
ncbi:ATP-dependent helicase [Candidatus Liberibacter americanus]|uniref:DNA 3'-5' helicase n=1 Tax=Candidatus Liberibacter americanus str. Sao Paulo TaxID=1261131 RepID=U6B568_9HYPH|nr:UvrD-helicase domain-containing protein [Candidatus Liberibacter americanus]AHA28189.1 ATP-dependent DNA helicase UvrD/PcrA [Candidatus Liberibacter americanus str. Sao Paulo]EMS36295.1 DNA helicase II [Candidatus Liberibacter americanus PW_SP]